MSQGKGNGNGRRWGLAAGAAAVAVVLVGVLLLGSGGGIRGEAAASVPTFTIKPGPLRISVSEAGTIKAREQITLKNEVEGRTTIIYLIEEGTRVEPGELLVELDATEMVDRRVDQQISVQNAEAAFIRARENLAVAKSQAKSDIAEAELAARFAKDDLAKYIEGEYPKMLMEAQNKITLAEQELTQAENTYLGSQRLYEEKYLSKTELDRDRLSRDRAALDLQLAKEELKLLEEYTYARELAQLESDVEQAAMALERVRRKASADVVQAEADLRAKEAEYGRQKDRLAKLEDQIAKAKVYAPAAGMVVYATTGQGGWRGNDEPLEEGREVREREELIHLPTASSMMAEIKVHESSLDKVEPGMPVRVTVDALPGRVFAGRVSKIAPLPDAQSVWLNPDLKVYNTEIMLDGEVPEVRTGMSCRAEIIVEEHREVASVPVQAVLRVGGQPTVYVMEQGQPTPRPVRIGLDNNRMVHVLDGLSAGDEVVLTPPLEAATVSDLALDDLSQPQAQAGEPVPGGGEASGAAASAGDTPAERSADAGPPEGDASGDDASGGEASGDDAAQQGMQEARRRFENMTDEQREEMRKRFENMTPEQRRQMMERFRQQQGGGGES